MITVQRRSQSKSNWVIAEVDVVRVGIAAQVVQQIGSLSSLGTVPRAPSHLLGLTLVRGEPVAVVDLAQFLELSPLPASPTDDSRQPRVITVATSGYRVGLAVSRVLGVRSCDVCDLAPAEVVQGGRIMDLALGEMDTDAGIVSVLDLDRLLSEARVRPG